MPDAQDVAAYDAGHIFGRQGCVRRTSDVRQDA